MSHPMLARKTNKKRLGLAVKALSIMGLVASSGLSPSLAQAGVKFSLFGAGQRLLGTTADGSTIDIGFGGGAALELGLGTSLSLDAGGIYLSRSASLAGTTFTTRAAQIPVGFRYRMGSMFSIGLGGWYELPMDSSGLSDYGAQANLRLSIPIKFAALFIEPRYNYGLRTFDDGSQSSEIVGLVGLTFGGMGK